MDNTSSEKEFRSSFRQAISGHITLSNDEIGQRSASLRDISLGGAKVVSLAYLPKNQKISLNFTLEKDQKLFSFLIDATVKRTKPILGNAMMYELGLEFQTLSNDAQINIQELIKT